MIDEPDSSQNLVNDCVYAAYSGRIVSERRWEAFSSFISGLAEDGDLYNCRWPGFIDSVNLGLGIDIVNIVNQTLEESGLPEGTTWSDQELVESFRGALEEARYQGPAYFCRSIRAADGRVAWVGFSQDETGGIEVDGVFVTPLAFEEYLRERGVVFPFPEETPPSDNTDQFSDEQILALLRDED